MKKKLSAYGTNVSGRFYVGRDNRYRYDEYEFAGRNERYKESYKEYDDDYLLDVEDAIMAAAAATPDEA